MREFNVKEAAEGCINWVNSWFEENGRGKKAYIGISGGKDSSVVAGICCEALGQNRVVGVMMPNHTQADISFSEDIIKMLQIKSYTYNVGPVLDEMEWMLEHMLGSEPKVSALARENVQPRVRMASLYYVAQYFGDGFVSNNCNASEEYIGYSTHYGDDAGDFAPIRDFTVSEVIAIGRYIGIPEKFLLKAPSDGLCGKTDEDKIGFTYAVLDKYIRTGVCENPEVLKKIIQMHKSSAFKRKAIAKYSYFTA